MNDGVNVRGKMNSEQAADATKVLLKSLGDNLKTFLGLKINSKSTGESSFYKSKTGSMSDKLREFQGNLNLLEEGYRDIEVEEEKRLKDHRVSTTKHS